jgi:exfoliative toxin A/B
MNIIKNLPLAITGLILAIFSLGKIFTEFSSIFFIIGTVLPRYNQHFKVSKKATLFFTYYRHNIRQITSHCNTHPAFQLLHQN